MQLTGCVTAGLANLVSRTSQVELQKDIPYGDSERQNFDLYLPKSPVSATTPVIVYFYGGGWTSGEKTMYRFLGRKLASMGYIVAIPDYRLYPMVTYPGFVQDCALAVKGIASRLQQPVYAPLKPDPEMILAGHSAGAYNSAMLTLDNQWLADYFPADTKIIKAWVGIAGPYDLYPIELKKVQPVFHHPNYPAGSNPVALVQDKLPPILLIAPEKDKVVNTERNTYQLADLLKQQNSDVHLVTVEGTNHVSIVANITPLLLSNKAFLDPMNTFINDLYE